VQLALHAKTVVDNLTFSLAAVWTEAATLQQATLKTRSFYVCLLRLELCVGNLLTCCQTRQDKAEKDVCCVKEEARNLRGHKDDFYFLNNFVSGALRLFF
jgi:hypothetical protein